MNRRGFALVAVLWTVVLLAGVVGGGVAVARHAQRAAGNRTVLARSRWAAEACLAIAQARWADGRLADTATIALGRTTQCRWTLEDPGARLDANLATPATILRLFLALGWPPDSATAFVEALVTRRDVGAITAREEIASLPGARRDVLRYLDVDGGGLVNTQAAERPVLAAVGGITPEAVDRALARRTAGRPIQSLDEWLTLLSPPARDAILARYAALMQEVCFGPQRLRLTAVGWVASYGDFPRATIELLVVPLPDRLAVVRRRMS
jgi:hypothetical protein